MYLYKISDPYFWLGLTQKAEYAFALFRQKFIANKARVCIITQFMLSMEF